MNDTNHMIAEVQMWQSRTSDLETTVERLREERDVLLSTIVTFRHREDVLMSRLTELDDIVKRLTIAVTRHRADGELYP
jgi:hypothetical protein